VTAFRDPARSIGLASRPGRRYQLVHQSKQYSTLGQISVRTTIIIMAVLIGFAILHIVGASLMRSGSDRATAEPAHLDGAD
jgi:hypothetical protein